ncbi:MAG: 3(or 17)beta-hydroxysteroid dehydrogenase [Candidatus Azotimanducaceae bacterium]|jgi:3(or 17)beta-hydroxysteroid dehydrogenase
MGNVKGKVVIVTGAASGLGEADARMLAANGASVIMTDINVAVGEQIAKQIGATFFEHDVARESRWADLTKLVERDFGRLDGLVNNAGIAVIANIETTTTEQWRRTMSIHLDGTFWGCQMAIALMKVSGGGSIINMSSTAALVGIPAYLAYSAAKGGIRSMTKSIAVHCKQQKLGIRCNSIHPGSISTPMVHAAVKKLAGIDMTALPDAEQGRKDMGIGEPDDVAHMVTYLISDAAKHINGAEMVIDNADTVG